MEEEIFKDLKNLRIVTRALYRSSVERGETVSTEDASEASEEEQAFVNQAKFIMRFLDKRGVRLCLTSALMGPNRVI